ncbi:MAG: DUF721 domain-containing protein [Pseudomonadota bacterium]
MTDERNREPRKLGNLLEAVLGEARFRHLQRLMALHHGWEQMAGGEILARAVRPIALEEGVLWLEADNPLWAQEAQLRSLQLVDGANAILGPGFWVREVRIIKSRPHQGPPRSRS